MGLAPVLEGLNQRPLDFDNAAVDGEGRFGRGEIDLILAFFSLRESKAIFLFWVCPQLLRRVIDIEGKGAIRMFLQTAFRGAIGGAEPALQRGVVSIPAPAVPLPIWLFAKLERQAPLGLAK